MSIKTQPDPPVCWKLREIHTGRFSCGGIDAVFNSVGRVFKNKIGAKGSLFHYVYGFSVDPDGLRRFHPRGARSVDDYEIVRIVDGAEVEAIGGRLAFTRNQLLNKQDRILDDLSPRELTAENLKQF